MKYILLLLLSVNIFAIDASIKIVTNVEQRTKIAIEDGSSVTNAKFFKTLLSDFKISGHFITNNNYNKADINSNFITPAHKSSAYVLKYKLDQRSGSKLTIRLLQSPSGAEVFKKSYAIPTTSKVPFLAHKAVSDINDVLKYPSISWINRYVIYARYLGAKQSEIILADYTFAYQKTIIRGGLNLFPKWADAKQQSFYYTSYAGVVPALYKLNIYTGSKSKIASSEGMIVCSDVKANGSKILVTMSPDAQADIYEMSSTGGSKRKITSFRGIDVNGKYIDNESKIVFVSNRLGYANIFKKSISGSGVSQIVYHGRNNNAVDAHGSKIVYSSRESQNSFGNNKFNLYLTSSNGGTTRPITTTGTNQFPHFSTDGSVVQYIKHNGGSSSIGYTNLISKQSLLFPLGGRKIQSIDW
ncbi:tolB protein precursor, periplasmic protein involved in the tonb-independent uptake of group A colicins [hydrothermal vent metagenome]|uniref:TolB protein, periplasmic protein involved in the tonb-independent uptake of group A colicins n=1 Tax=hydrothermal vent metagenome TaxID=652676 RepID=A0A1W1ED51_9ZZZZ